MSIAGWLTLLVVIVAVISRPVEIRLWRAGRLSDRATALLLVGRFPVVVFLFGVLLGMQAPVLLALTAMTALGPVLFYRYTLQLLQDQRREMEKQGPTARARSPVAQGRPGGQAPDTTPRT